jgi:hypothetical protein
VSVPVSKYRWVWISIASLWGMTCPIGHEVHDMGYVMPARKQSRVGDIKKGKIGFFLPIGNSFVVSQKEKTCRTRRSPFTMSHNFATLLYPPSMSSMTTGLRNVE